jgi:catechol 2,3-dioxygenase-like lactoylglutathione lyase family enzyme
MVEGLSHITLVVADLERTTRLIVEILGGTEEYSSGEATFSIAPEKFFLVHDIWIAVMEGAPLQERTYNHLAFKISVEDLRPCRAAIQRLGLEMLESRPRIEGEGDSLYFYDEDNHLFELHTGTLEQRLARYRAGRAPAP